MREPIPVFLMTIAMLVYPSVQSGLFVQSILFLGTALVIYAILQNYDRRMALLAALLWVISIPVFTQIGDDTGELAAAFFLSLGLFFFMKGIREPDKLRSWIVSGIFMGLASLSRTVLFGTSLGLSFFLFVFSLYNGRKTFPKKWRNQVAPAFLFLTTLVLLYTPWVVRNRLVFGSPVIGSTLTGYNVYRMNSIVADEFFFPHYVGSKDGYTMMMQLVRDSNLSGVENEAQMQSLYMKAGFKIVFQHPVQYTRLALYRFLSLWFNASVDAAYGLKPGFLDLITTIEQGLLLIAVVIGIAKNRKETWPFIVILTLGSSAYMAIDAQLRYLVDFMPVIVILAASALTILQPVKT
jgi:4-amino-4-deoxy-L-arabinose transferase-like glycosyltransferase